MVAMKDFSLLIKPTSADCNLRCQYCFYLNKNRLYPQTQIHRMRDSVLEHLVRSYLAIRQNVYSFAWQGGEPTLMGTNFFKRITELQEKYASPGSRVANSLQTNTTLIDDALAAHLTQYHFLVGCSLDGPPAIHNLYRKYPSAKPSHATVMKGIETLRRHRVEFNILLLVSKANVHQAGRVYRYLVDHGFYFHQYIPCVEFDENGKPLPFSINGDEWGRFLCEIFDHWYPHDVRRVSIRHFDALLNKRLDHTESVCSLSDNCCQYFVVEYNGDIYPCDFFVQKDLKIGNIADTSWEKALSSPLYHNFGQQKSRMDPQCLKCNYIDLCMGDCQKHRMKNSTQIPGRSHLCSGWQQFFKHTERAFDNLEKMVQADRTADNSPYQLSSPIQTKAKIGRNQICPCGSGRKYKNAAVDEVNITPSR